MNHPTNESLNDFADGLLPPDERSRVEEHLRRCDTCRSEVESVRFFSSEAARWPLEVDPPRDLWPEIDVGIRSSSRPPMDDVRRRREARRAGARRARPWARPVLLAAAALVLLTVASGVALMIARTGVPEGPAAPSRLAEAEATGPDVPVMAVVREMEEAYDPAIRELREILEAGRDELAPETVQVLEESLRIMEEAIREAREALEADPASPGVARSLRGMYERKLDLLRQAASLTRGA